MPSNSRKNRGSSSMPPSGPHVDLGHPAADAVRVELVVPRRVERVGEVDALAVAADLDHLRTAVQRLPRLAGMRRAATMPPSRIELTFFGLNGSLTSYWMNSPVPKHET